MEGIVACLGRDRNGAFKRKAQTAADGKLAKRYVTIVNLDEGRSNRGTARALGDEGWMTTWSVRKPVAC